MCEEKELRGSSRRKRQVEVDREDNGEEEQAHEKEEGEE